MKLFRKKRTPEEVKTKLKISNVKLDKREREIEKKKSEARKKAKSSLKEGDDRGFRVSSKKYGMLQSQQRAISSMNEMSMSMMDVIDMQTSMGEIVEIGNMLGEYQKDMGIDSEKMEKALGNITSSMDSMNTATEIMVTTVEGVLSGDAEASEAQESLKAELMAELVEEGEKETALKDKIKKAQKD